VPVGTSFDLAGCLPAALTSALATSIRHARADGPPGALVVNAGGTIARFRDPEGQIAPGITGLALKLRNAATREYELQVKGKRMDLALLDKNHIALALETDEAAFVKTRTFKQSGGAKRTTIKVVER
jgi:hypothetical protein